MRPPGPPCPERTAVRWEKSNGMARTRRTRTPESRRLDPTTEEALFLEWEPLAQALARRMARQTGGVVDREDLDQVARLALLGAIRRFDPTRGCQFSTFGVPTIAGELKRYLRDRAPAVRIPRRWFELRPRLMGATEALSQALGRGPTVAELAESLGTSEEAVEGALVVPDLYCPVSLDEAGETPEGFSAALSLHDAIGTEDPLLEQAELRVIVQQLLEALPARLRRLIWLRYFKGMSQQEVGQHLGVSQMQVSRLERRTLAYFREQLCRAGSGGLENVEGIPDRFLPCRSSECQRVLASV